MSRCKISGSLDAFILAALGVFLPLTPKRMVVLVLLPHSLGFAVVTVAGTVCLRFLVPWIFGLLGIVKSK